jgi:predicted acyltransferase
MRGMTVALMIIVNNPGSWNDIYAPFRHAEWHGFTLTDLVFPTFLFAVGNSMSFTRKVIGAVSEGVFYKKVLKRSATIFLIGFLLLYFPSFKIEDGKIIFINALDARLWGVLQRIAVCYLLASIAIHYLDKKGIIILSVVTLLGYWVLLYFGNPNDPCSLHGNLLRTVDMFLVNPKNLYQGFGTAFEPEGLLSTFPATVNVLSGYLIGLFVQSSGKKRNKALKTAITGAVLVAVALPWNISFPINKAIWTSSYVLLTVGLDLLILAMLIVLIELANLRRPTYFFVVFGKNPVFIYIISWRVIKLFILSPLQIHP